MVSDEVLFQKCSLPFLISYIEQDNDDNEDECGEEDHGDNEERAGGCGCNEEGCCYIRSGPEISNVQLSNKYLVTHVDILL